MPRGRLLQQCLSSVVKGVSPLWVANLLGALVVVGPCWPAGGDEVSDSGGSAAKSGATRPTGASGAQGVPDQDARGVVVWTVEQLRAAIANMAPGGGRILVRAGRYDVSAPIVVNRDNIVIEGEGTATFFRLTDGANCPCFVIGEPAPVLPDIIHQNIVLRSLRIDGNRTQQGPELCTIPGWEHLRNNCVTLRRVKDCTVEDVLVEQARSGGLVLEQGCDSVLLRGITARANYFDGIACCATTKSLIVHCRTTGNGAAGLSFDHAFDNNLISECVVTDNSSVGLFLSASRANQIQNCTFARNRQDGVFIRDGEPPVPLPTTRNYFSHNTYIANGRHGIWQAGPNSIENVLSCGLFWGNGVSDIQEEPAAPLIKHDGCIARLPRGGQP